MSYHALFVSGNPKDDLGLLREEFQNIEASVNRQSETIVTATYNFYTREKGIFNAFTSKKNIRIFHFSGHAGDGGILMDTGSKASGRLIANILEYGVNLHLVFLNGCATYDLVDEFLKIGAKVVIATSAKVFDKVACKFSSSFYENLFEHGQTVAESFDNAKISVLDSIRGQLSETKKAETGGNAVEGNSSDDYKKLLELLSQMGSARSFASNPQDTRGEFEWSIHYRKDKPVDVRIKDGEWTVSLKDKGEHTPIHALLGLDFVRQTGKAALAVRDILGAGHARASRFTPVSESLVGAKILGLQHTNNLIKGLENLLLLPLQEPFKRLAKHFNKSDFEKTPENLKQLLEFELELYKAFIRTATAIMIADFFECIIKIQRAPSEDLKTTARRVLKASIDESPELKGLLDQLLRSEKILEDFSYDVKLIRNISICLRKCRENGPDTAEMFDQFVAQYGPASDPAVSSQIDKAHDTFSTLNAFVERNDLDRAEINWLKYYCDLAEDALIALFTHHAYAFAYEMVTVGKVEAVRPRVKLPKTIRHELYFSSLGDPLAIPYEDEFAQNYSVMLVLSERQIANALSLSPFIINVAAFAGTGTSLLFFFNGANGNLAQYIELLEYKSPNYHSLEIAPDAYNQIDQSRIIRNNTAGKAFNNKDETINAAVAEKYDGVRLQLDTLVTEIKRLIDQ